MTQNLIVLSDKETAALTDDTGTTTVPLSAIASSDSKNTLLPANCRVHISDGQTHVFVIEHQPCIREVNWKPNPEEWKNLIARGAKSFAQVDGNETRTSFLLAFPYTVFFVCMEGTEVKSVRVFFRSHTIFSADDYLQRAGLIHNDTLVVTDQAQLRHHGMTTTSTAEVAVEHFWRQTLGTGDPIGTVHTNVPEVASVWEWEVASRKPQDWILKARWTRTESILQTEARAMLQTPAIEDGVDPIYSAIAERIQRHTSKTTKPRDCDLIENPSVAVLLGTTRVRQGDVIVSGKRQFGCKRGGQYLVLGLFERTIKGVVHAKIENVAAPVPIGSSRGLIDFTLFKPKREVKNEIVCNGVTFKEGVSFCVSSNEDIPALTKDHEYRINKLEVDPEGDARVKVAGHGDLIYITHEGGKLLPSVYQNIPCLQDNTFTCGRYKMSVGDVVRVIAGGALQTDKLFRVSSLSQKDETHFAMFDGHKYKVTLYENGRRNLAWSNVVYEFSDRRVVLDDKTLDMTENKFLLVTTSDDPKQVGKLLEQQGFVHSSDGDALDVNLIVNEKHIQVIHKSNWVFTDTYEQVSVSYEDKALTLQAGDVLVCQEAIEGLNAGEELTIICFGKNKNDPKLTDMIFSDGRSICLSQASLNLFSRKNGKAWKEKELAELTKGSLPNIRVQPGERCVYREYEKYLFGTVIKKDWDERFVVFDSPQPNGSLPNFREGWIGWNRLEHLDVVKVDYRFFKAFGDLANQVAKRSNGEVVSIPPELIAMRTKLTAVPTPLTDSLKNKLTIGDIVVPTRSGYGTECPSSALGIPMLIVGAPSDFLYLWAGSKYKPNIIPDDARCFGILPEHIQVLRAELYANPPNCCERLMFATS